MSDAATVHPPNTAQASPPMQHLVLVLMADEEASRLVEQAQRLHRVLGGRWSVVALETLESRQRPARLQAHLLDALTLAELGGAAVTHLSLNSYSESSAVSALVHRAQSEHATVLMIGRARLGGGPLASQGPNLSHFAEVLTQLLPGVIVHLVAMPAAATPPAGRAAPRQARGRARWRPWLEALATLVVCTLAGLVLETSFRSASLALIYLAGVVVVASRGHRAATLLMVLSSILVYDLLFVAPRGSLKPADPQDGLAFGLMLFAGLLISHLGTRMREQADVAESRAQRAMALNRLALRLAASPSPQAVAQALCDSLRGALGTDAVVLVPEPGDGGLLSLGITPPGLEADVETAALAHARGVEAGAGTPHRQQQPLLYLPLRSGDERLGVLVVTPLAAAQDTLEDRHLMRALAHQAATALSRAGFERRSIAAAIETERERLRNTLLAGISHDFRTPLTAIVGNASTLLQQGHALDDGARRDLLGSLLQQAQRLQMLTSNLLDLTRFQEGAIRPSLEWCPADELVAEACLAVQSQLGRRRLDIEVDATTVVWCDAHLVGQILVNLLDNAIRHTPDGGAVRVSVRADREHWTLVVHDEGPGVPSGEEASVFERFHRAGDRDGAGKGLGLAICAAVAQLHGGTIAVRNEGGARFEMILPQAAAPALDEDPA